MRLAQGTKKPVNGTNAATASSAQRLPQKLFRRRDVSVYGHERATNRAGEETDANE